MKANLIIIFLLFSVSQLESQEFNMQLDWATYYGNDRMVIKSMAADQEGNIYLVGYYRLYYLPEETPPPHFDFTDETSYQPAFSGGLSDAFLLKISPQGRPVWGTFLGGEGMDIFYDIKFTDENHFLVIGGTNSSSGISTPNATQMVYGGNGDTVIAKWNITGDLIWSTYYGNHMPQTINQYTGFWDEETHTTNLVVAPGGDFYFYSSGSVEATPGTFQQEPSTSFICRFNSSGELIWSTNYGINFSKIGGLAVSENFLYITGETGDVSADAPNTYFDTTGTYTPLFPSLSEIFITCFDSHGQRIWSRYFGGHSYEQIHKNSLVLTNDYLYLTGGTNSDEGITTDGSYNETTNFPPDPTTFLAKFDLNGNQIWGTYIEDWESNANSGFFGLRHIFSDSDNNLIITGITHYPSVGIPSEGAFQDSLVNYGYDSFIVKFNQNGEKIWGTYFGGAEDEYITPMMAFYNDTFYFAANFLSTGLATAGAFQENHISPGRYIPFIGKFAPQPLSVEDQIDNIAIKIYPNPARDVLHIDAAEEIIKMQIFDIQGKLIKTVSGSKQIDVSALSKGLYILRITTASGGYSEKFIKE